MVIRFGLVVAVCAGCLGKPGLPVAHDAGMTDTTEPDTLEEELACTTFPADVEINRAIEVADIDRRDGTTADDLLLLSRVGTSGGYVYQIAGADPLRVDCYHRRFEFLSPTEVTPLDTFVGDVTGDQRLDLVMFGRELATVTDQSHEVLLFVGDETGTIPTTHASAQRVPVQSPYDSWGTEEEPQYVTAYRQSGEPTAELVVGGLYGRQAAIPVLAPGTLSAALATEQVNGDVLDGLAVQDISVHAKGDPEQLLLVSQGSVVRLASTNQRSNGRSTFAVLDTTTLGTTQQRFVRYARTLVGGATLGVTQRDPGFYSIIQVAGTANEVTVVAPLAAPGIDDYSSRDFALENIAGNPAIELVALHTAASGMVKLRVYPNLVVSGTATVTHDIVRELMVSDEYVRVAVGDFDGLAATRPQILVIPKVMDTPILCYQLVAGCLATCGTPSC